MARFCFNRFLREGMTAEAGWRLDVLAFHRSLEGYAPTPLHALPRMAGALGIGGLYVKDESRRLGLKAFKGLGASWAIHALLAERRAAGFAPPARVATATDGNHGRAVAWAARRAGIAATIYIPAHAAPARVEAIRAEGAEVVLVDGTYDDAVARCAAEAGANGWQVVADTGYEGAMETPRLVAQGYSTLFQEIDAQIDARLAPQPNFVLVQAGVGALAAAAVEHYRARRERPALVLVEPLEAAGLLESIATEGGQPRAASGRLATIMAGLNCAMPSLAAWPAIRRGVDLFVAIEDAWAEDAVRRLFAPAARTRPKVAAGGPGGPRAAAGGPDRAREASDDDRDPSIEAGESGAAGLAGLLALLRDAGLAEARERLALGGDTVALVLNTEGATDPAGFRRITGIDPPADR